MKNYICTCGQEFNSKKDAEYHINNVYIYNQGGFHGIAKLSWKGRLINFLSDPNTFGIICKFIGYWLIYFTILRHFNISFSALESLFIGVGIGLLLNARNICK